MEELIHAKIALAILRGDVISEYIAQLNKNLYTHDEDKVELLNLVFVPYCKQYKECSTDDSRQSCIDRLRISMKMLAPIIGVDYIDVGVFENLLRFSNVRPINSPDLRAILIDLMKALGNTQSEAVRLYMYKNIINYIIHCGLYGAQPYDQILEECTNWLDGNAFVVASSINFLWWRVVMQ